MDVNYVYKKWGIIACISVVCLITFVVVFVVIQNKGNNLGMKLQKISESVDMSNKDKDEQFESVYSVVDSFYEKLNVVQNKFEKFVNESKLKEKECLPPRKIVGTECFSIHVDKSLNWNDAYTYCKTIGGRMPEFNNEQLIFKNLNVAFPALHTKTKDTKYVDLWLDAKDDQAEGHWAWGSGTPLKQNDTRWAPGQPNNWSGRQDCLVLEYDTTRGKSLVGLEDEDCTLKFSVICEYD